MTANEHDGGALPVLEVRGLTVSFGGIRALSDVDFTVAPGEIAALIGPNGAGKTTLLNAVGRLIPSKGTIRVGGRDVTRLRPDKAAAAGIGRSFQDPALIEQYTVIENVLCGAYLRLRYSMLHQLMFRSRVRRIETDARRQAMEVLELVDLRDQANAPCHSLPYGARKLVDIARALMSEPSLLMLDEPSSGVDEAERRTIANVLKALKERGGNDSMAVVVVEHHMDLVRSCATQVAALVAGSLLMTGPPAEVLDSERFRAAVTGEPVGERSPAPAEKSGP